METKKNFNDKISDFIMGTLVEPMNKIGSNPIIASIRDGLIATMPIIIVGSAFLMLFALSTPSVANKVMLPFLTAYAGKFIVVFQLTMSLMSMYASVTIAMNYGKHYKLDQIACAVIGLMSFFLITTNVVTDGSVAVGSFSATGLFATMITSIFGIAVLRFCVEKNIIIKMPEGVPPAVGNAFTALIPFTIVAMITWGIRTLVGFDFVTFLANVLKPILSASDTTVVFTFVTFFKTLLWSVGLHGDNMIAAVTNPLMISNMADNAKAMASGIDPLHLPHIWTNVVERICVWTSCAWGCIFWMFKSKAKYVKTFAKAVTPAALFTIIEPLVFGLPLVMNPFLLIPFVLSATISAAVTFLAFDLHLVARPFIELPWATPPFVNAYIATGGDWKAVILVFISLAIGIIVYAPFFKAFEKDALEKEKEAVEANQQQDS